MKDKPRSTATTITVGMTSPLSPNYGTPLDLDVFYDVDDDDASLDHNNNNNNSINDYYGHTHQEMNTYNYSTSTFPRRAQKAKNMNSAETKARLPVFKLLQINRIKAEKIAQMPGNKTRHKCPHVLVIKALQISFTNLTDILVKKGLRLQDFNC